jgi:hypothetical protein
MTDANQKISPRRRLSDPVKGFDFERITRRVAETIPMRDEDEVPGDVLPLDEPGTVRKAQALALSDGVEPVSLVAAEDTSCLELHDLPLPLAQVVAHELAVGDLS